MVEVIKNICIFMIIAQAVLLLVPGNSYMKYVKVLIGILMILMLSGALLSWFGEEGIKAEQIIKEMEEGMPEMSGVWEKEADVSIYDGIENELKEKLNASVQNQKYGVREVELKKSEDGMTIESVLIVVEAYREETEKQIRIEPVKLGENNIPEEEESLKLKQAYGACLGIDPERIEISVGYG